MAAPGHLEGGDSLRPLLENPDLEWDRVALSTWGQNNHSIRSQHYRYTRYADGAEEVYDEDNDPAEWTNLASDPAMDPVKARLSAYFPTTNVEMWRDPNAPARGRPPVPVSTDD